MICCNYLLLFQTPFLHFWWIGVSHTTIHCPEFVSFDFLSQFFWFGFNRKCKCSILVRRVVFKVLWVLNYLQTHHLKCKERILPALCHSRQKDKRNHEVLLHQEKGPWSSCSISLPIQWTLSALHINQYLTKIVAYLPINYQCTALISLPIQWALSALYINQYLTEISSVFAYQLSIHCFD